MVEYQRYKDLQERIRSNVKYMRESAGLTITELARGSGMKLGNLSSIERGKRTIGLRTLCDYSQYFGVPIGVITDKDLREDKSELVGVLLRGRLAKETKASID